ncbi:hypothetical protein [Wenzhouxiangella sediminis]|uniref:Uncharacterized protein n=1 Tax=Wenzhouxiangella sediminis TaxID=1792836 RepID=A0A3E1K8Z1_9GAMM|nr:hypothetical protein [Wenzhouxiangella sediminis]RFF30546.1 hypothetical protein DZC52_07385 [Wenzhouxiangella sediminis]
MNRREFVSFAALSGAVAVPSSSRAVAGLSGALRCRSTRLDESRPAIDADHHAPAGFRLDLLGAAEGEPDCDRPGFGLKAIYSGLLSGNEFTLVHPSRGEVSRRGSLHFGRGSLAGLEVQWANRRSFVAAAELFGHRPRPGRYRLDVNGTDGDGVSLEFRLVAA